MTAIRKGALILLPRKLYPNNPQVEKNEKGGQEKKEIKTMSKIRRRRILINI